MTLAPVTLRARFLVEHLNLPLATGDPEAVLEDAQVDLWNATGMFYATNKARQIGWSWAAAADAVAASILSPGTVSQFVSFNLAEAREKTRYSLDILRALHSSVRPAIVRESQEEIEIYNGSRLISMPARPPRGKARPRLYLDELAHVGAGLDVEIFRGALGSLGRAGVIRVGSTPLGCRGKFHELLTGENPDWQRSSWPWWTARGLCLDVDRAALEAPGMSTEDRVAAFGTDRLRALRAGFGSDVDGFAQELECAFIDEAGSFLAYELIMSCEADFTPAPEGTGPVYVGIDIGRKHDRTAIVALQRTGEVYRVVLLDVLANMPFADQEARIGEHIDRLRPVRVAVDASGLGAPMAESLKARHGGRVEPITFTAPVKEDLMGALRAALERHSLVLPIDRALRADLHAIRAERTTAGNLRFCADRTEDGHADRAWALALAVHAAPSLERRQGKFEITIIPSGRTTGWGGA